MRCDKKQHDKKQHDGKQSWTVKLAAVAGIAIVTAACGGGGKPAQASDPSASATTPAEMALEYAQCVRSHGVPKYPDPTINGNSIGSGISPNTLGVSQSVLQAAQNACKSLSPQNFRPPNFNQAQNTAQAEKWAECLRKHGVPDFPDPGSDGSFSVPASIDLQGSAFAAANTACQSVRPRALRMSQRNPGPSPGSS